MDELSAFKFAPPCLIKREQKLSYKKQILFLLLQSAKAFNLAKDILHDNIHPFSQQY